MNMKVEILLVGKHTNVHPPSRYALYRKTLRSSESSVYATHSYIWTNDSFWGSLREVPVHEDGLYAYRGEVDVAFNDGDADVLLMLGKAITYAVGDLVCRVSIITETPLLHTKDVLLLHLADSLEDERFHLDFLEWARESEWSYHKGLEGRLWLGRGQVRLLSATAKTIVFNPKSNSLEGDFQPICSLLAHLGDVSKQEKFLSDSLHQWVIHELDVKMRQSAVSLFVRLPPLLAGVIRDIPSPLLYRCLLDHLIYFPTIIGGPDVQHSKPTVEEWYVRPLCEPHTRWASASGRLEHLSYQEEYEISQKETSTFQRVYNELCTTQINNRMVRVPIVNLPSYIFLLLRSDSFPSSFCIPECKDESAFDQRRSQINELVLGAKISFAMERWRYANSPSHGEMPIIGRAKANREDWQVMSNSFENVQSKLNHCLESKSNSSSLFNDGLESFRKDVMHPYPVDYPISLISNAPLEELLGRVEDDGDSAGKDLFERFDSAMRNRCQDEGKVSSSSSTDLNTSETSSSYHSSVVDEVLDEMSDVFFDELHVTEGSTRSQNGSGVNVDRSAVNGIVDNPLFLNVIQSLADN